VEGIAAMINEELLQLPPVLNEVDSAIARVLAVCRQSPSIYILSDESIALRAEYARTGHAPRSLMLLKMSRAAVEEALAKHNLTIEGPDPRRDQAQDEVTED
jgi:hypothetical protein